MTTIRDWLILMPLFVITPLTLFAELTNHTTVEYILLSMFCAAQIMPSFVTVSKFVEFVTGLVPFFLLNIKYAQLMLMDTSITRGWITQNAWPLRVIDLEPEGGAVSWLVLILSLIVLFGSPLLMMVPHANVRKWSGLAALVALAMYIILCPVNAIDAQLHILSFMFAARLSASAEPEHTPLRNLPARVPAMGCAGIDLRVV